MLGFYPFSVYEHKVKEIMDRGLSRSEAKFIINQEERRAYWEYQRKIEEDNQAWFDEIEGDEYR